MRGPLAFRFACAPMPPAASLAVPDDHRGILRLDDAHNIEQLLLARLLDGNDAQPFALTASSNIDSKFAHVGDEVGPVFVYVDTLDFGICSGNDTPAADEAIVVKKEAVVEHMLSVQIRVDEQRQDAILTARLKAGLRSPQLRIFTPCAERKTPPMMATTITMSDTALPPVLPPSICTNAARNTAIRNVANSRYITRSPYPTRRYRSSRSIMSR